MPKRTDIKSILVIGSGPIVIGQGCEFDYAGTQACLALKKENYRVILINSNPATIMTDPELADVTYIEPMTDEIIIEIIAKERPDALLPTMGGQIALNAAMRLSEKNILKNYFVELLGVSQESIHLAENRILFRHKMLDLQLKVPLSEFVINKNEVFNQAKKIGYPVLIRQSFALGGTGAAIVNDHDELTKILLKQQTNSVCVLDQALFGWKEYELEVIRDSADNCIVVCGIENINPLGIHTGDSITVSPIMTLTDKEYQVMRNAAFSIMRAFRIIGGANIQFAVQPQTGEMLIIEMNPRVSRSSALASKATGYPIAKIAALLAVGYTLDELKSDIIEEKIPAAFEPVMDYVVVKMPCFQFEKFPVANDILLPQMQSIGEVMGIGRTFPDALQKAIRSLELNYEGLDKVASNQDEIIELLRVPNSKQLWAIADAFRLGMSLEVIYNYTHIDPWFLYQIKELVEIESFMDHGELTQANLYQYKRKGFSDKRIATITQYSEQFIYDLRKRWKLRPVYKRIDSCAGEFSTATAYMYSSYDQECESEPTLNKKMVVIGSGPNRIGQGIEFDYSCVHAIESLKKLGYETIIINSNPETVSTDYFIADRLYFSPLVAEDVLEILEKEKPDGVLLQFGGQTSLNLAKQLSALGFNVLGLSVQQIEFTQDRHQFGRILDAINLPYPKKVHICPEQSNNVSELIAEMQFPMIIRPSYIIGGTRIRVIDTVQQLIEIMSLASGPVMIEEYLQDAIEIEIDAISDGHDVYIPAIIENIDPVGIHSGDSTCCIPPVRISNQTQGILREYTQLIADKLQLVGLFNIQFAVCHENIYILEVNPRASRTVPFVSKACGINLVSTAIQCVMGKSIKNQNLKEINSKYIAMKKPVFPEDRFPSIALGPEMKSTGEVMSFGSTFLEANEKIQVLTSVRQAFPVRSLQEIHQSVEEMCHA